jgi:hypothetical protein
LKVCSNIIIDEDSNGKPGFLGAENFRKKWQENI